ncbi:MAG TPA: PH domain-containing protein [Actinomycetaceae bacterium]|nr:PH domain-containing protein [Actinomycetaceae bacterium]
MDSLRPFRPRWARAVAWGLVAIVVVVVGVLFALAIVGYLPAWHLADQVLTVIFFGVGVWIMARLALVQATPDETGLTVRNFIHTRRVTWEEIVHVSLTRGRPWADLDLSDGSTLAVMGIQSADGEYGVREARRLAALVASREGRD